MRTNLETRLKVIFDNIITILAILAGIVVVFILLSVNLDVIARNLLGHPITGVLETCEIGLVAIAFLGAAWLLKKEGHITMDMVITRLNPRSQALLNMTTSLACAAICLIIAWYGMKLSYNYYQKGTVTPTVLALPMFPRYTIIALGSFVLFIQFLRRSYGNLIKWRSSKEHKQGR